jgi:lipoprotein-releasing system permease protein
MMIISIGTGIGLQQKIRQKISAFNGHLIISKYSGNQSDVSVTPLSINQNFYPKFTDVEGVKHVQGVISKTGIIRTETAFEGILFKGVGNDFDWENINEFILAGKTPNLKGILNTEIVISKFLANRLNLKLGDSFNVFFKREDGNPMPKSRRFTIVGLFDSGFQEFDSSIVLGDIRHLQMINKWDANQVGSFEVFIDDFSKIQSKSNEVYQSISSNLNVQPITEKYFYIFEWLELFDFNILVILIIMTVVATINMIVALLVLILERTQMIGILKSLGADNWAVRKIFLYNAFYLLLRGLLWGNAIGIGLLFIQKHFKVIQLNPESYYVNVAPVDINLLYILALNVGTVLTCLLVLLIPSYIITKISPSKTIRFE